ncbi:MAG: hypothetical protein A3G34_11615 [Candidatus Lindowbacteria bacterium RIFCSPLOWO2_12_FULL_62_27]|nr:MAG: hypothetical protein A3G34_11615 [Candidatus Lindowbacteria bacterium RIFCSPLOWO2_12_FULL_62_27]OGH61175.1 MAG: hypothetical protein A3I06_04745 [Candidatus Lindowbacteria bacterium RIFCSPLOWO2_02_FULL_62_12]
MIGIKKPEQTLMQKIYLPEILRGLAITIRHMLRQKPVTCEYPEKPHVVPPNFRGLHRLIQRPGGRERCVACELCLTACPANCISMVAADPNDPNVEKYPLRYEIDVLRCIYCGFCEEACPCDAIELTPHYEMASSRREDFIFTKDRLLDNNRYVPEGERVSKVRTNETYLRI